MNKKAVFYYIASSGDAKARHICACRLTEKAYQQKLKVYIYSSSQEEVASIDTQLWTFRDISFIPHGVHALTARVSTPIEVPPIIIGSCAPPSLQDHQREVLINLTQTIPDFHNDFPHLIEIIDNDDAAKLEATKHQEHYSKLGYEIVLHNL